MVFEFCVSGFFLHVPTLIPVNETARESCASSGHTRQGQFSWKTYHLPACLDVNTVPRLCRLRAACPCSRMPSIVRTLPKHMKGGYTQNSGHHILVGDVLGTTAMLLRLKAGPFHPSAYRFCIHHEQITGRTRNHRLLVHILSWHSEGVNSTPCAACFWSVQLGVRPSKISSAQCKTAPATSQRGPKESPSIQHLLHSEIQMQVILSINIAILPYPPPL